MQAGHITLEHPSYRDAPAVDLWLDDARRLSSELAQWPEVRTAKSIIFGQGIAKSSAGNTGASIMGVEPSTEASSSPLVRNMIHGQYLSEQDKASVVIGAEMAERLNLGVGKKLVLASNDSRGNLVEALCRVKGVFETGSEELDTYFVQVPLKFARRLFNMPEGSVTQMGIILDDPGDLRGVLKKLRKEVASRGVSARSWQQVMPEMASYIKVDKGANLVLQGILIFLILFTIFNTILMSVLERRREFAVLLALGTKPGQLRLQIFVESALVGLIGSGVGMLLGGMAAFLVDYWGVDLRSLLQEGIMISGFALSTELHARLTPGILLTSAFIVLSATILLSLIPMGRATRVSMADVLR
jgi:ABC-type lipoprotein release transport system permease subunit